MSDGSFSSLLCDVRAIQDRECPIESYMIEPMMRSRTAGHVPLCSVLHWIMTEAGKKPQYLEDMQSWKAAIGKLFPLIETGEIQIVGKRPDAQTKPIDGVNFVGICFGSPLQGSPDLIYGDNPWIDFAPYIDEAHWRGGFNDCMYLSKAGPASWTHLQVKRADVLRHITFEAAMPDKSGGQSFKAKDAVLVEEMHALILEGKAKNVSAAARAVVQKAQKLGSDDSAVERLRRAYGAKYPTRKRP
jgi:hypothetical protein